MNVYRPLFLILFIAIFGINCMIGDLPNIDLAPPLNLVIKNMNQNSDVIYFDISFYAYNGGADESEYEYFNGYNIYASIVSEKDLYAKYLARVNFGQDAFEDGDNGEVRLIIDTLYGMSIAENSFLMRSNDLPTISKDKVSNYSSQVDERTCRIFLKGSTSDLPDTITDESCNISATTFEVPVYKVNYEYALTSDPETEIQLETLESGHPDPDYVAAHIRSLCTLGGANVSQSDCPADETVEIKKYCSSDSCNEDDIDDILVSVIEEESYLLYELPALDDFPDGAYIYLGLSALAEVDGIESPLSDIANKEIIFSSIE